MPNSTAGAPWLRSEVALAAGRGALAGAMVWDLFEILTRRLTLSGGGEWVAHWLPPLLFLAAGSPRVLSWIAARARQHMGAEASGPAPGDRLYLGVLSGRSATTLAVVALVLLAAHGRESWAWDSAADYAGYLLIPAAITWAWTLGGQPGQRWKLAGVIGALAGAGWEAVTLAFLSSQIANAVDTSGLSVVTFRNLLPGAFTWAVLAMAGAFAVDRRFAGTTSLPARLAVALGITGFAVQLVEVVTKLGTIYIGGQIDVADAAAGVVSGPEMLSLAFMAVGWAIGAATAPAAATLLQPAVATAPLQGAPAAPAGGD